MDSGDGEQRDGEYRTFSHPNFQRNAQSSTLFIPVEKLIHDWAGLSFQELLQKLEARELPSTTLLPSDTGSGSGAGENSPIPDTSPVPSQHQFDLNSTPETQCYSFPTFAPITPDKSVISDNLNVDDTTDQERERDTTTTLKDQPKSLLATDLTKFQENQNPENVVSNEIDLNKTMQQKQRRKKHRPKVIAERKPGTPKPATPATKENPTGKRKYVRKKPKEIAPETPSKEAEQHGSGKRSPPQKKSCKRALNFDEMDAGDECTGCSYFNVNSEPNGHRLCTRSVSKVTVQLCQGIEEVTVRNTQAQITLENTAQGILDRDSRAFSTYPTDSDRSSTVNLTKGNEYKGNYSHAIKQASSGNIYMNGIHYNSAKAYHFISWQNNKKRRSDKGVNNIASNAAFYDAEKYFGAEATEKDSGVVLETYGQAQKGLQDGQTNGHIVIDLTAYERPTKKRSRNATKARDLASLAKMAPQAMANSHRTEQPESCIDALIAHTRATIAKRKRTKKRNLAVVQYSSMQKTYPSSGVPREVELAKMSTVEDIERHLKCLDINTESSTFTCPPENAIVPFLTRCQENNTLVLYQGAGMVVPFGPMTPIKKPRPRPKVDLDEETTRVWKLLLENINSEGIDGTDEQKAKWWEEERKVFRGRADSFIARMHLVQGDRRFSKWKGSVLDSVVGVFLTQNVSDHLSSSAFMSLAARYPIQSKNRNKACMVSDELQAYVSKNTRNWPASGSSFTPHDVEVMTLDAEDNEINEITGPDRKETLESNAAECCMELEEIAAVRLLSLQQCVDCSTSQTSNETGSCSESNSNVDDLANRCEPDSLEGSTSLLENLHVDEPTVVQEAYHGSDEMSSDTKLTETLLEAPSCPRVPCNNTLADKDTSVESQSRSATNLKNFEETTQEKSNWLQQNLQNHSDATQFVVNHTVKSDLKECGPSLSTEYSQIDAATSKPKSARLRKEKDDRDWDQLRKQAEANGRRQRTENTMDSLDWEALRCDDVDEVANTIKERGMNNKLARRIQDFLNRLVIEHGNTDLEWLRDVPPDQAKEYLLSIRGLGLKSVECVRLLTLHHLAFPVDTNVGRIAVRLGWVPLQPLPESLQLHLLELYPVLETIQKYLWPRLCKLDQRTLYELHYQMITFGKVFCTKSKPNCNSCPMRGECRHFASAFASARLALPGPEEKSIVPATKNGKEDANIPGTNERTPLSVPRLSCCEPIIEEPATPETESPIGDIEDFPSEDPDEIPTIKLNKEEFTQNLQNYMLKNMELQVGDMSKALVALDPEVASIPMPKLKNVNRLRTEHQVYELPDTHPLLERLQMEKREADDPSPYLLAIWTPGETPNSISPPDKRCCSQALGKLCNDAECFSCNSIREANSQTVRGTLLIPCRTAMRGSFPLNGTYFQVNEVFADNDSSLNPINVPRAWIWNLQRRTVYFGTSIPTIFRGLTTQGIQQCFWRGYVCVRGFDQKSRAPRPLMARLHFPASKGRRTRDPKADE